MDGSEHLAGPVAGADWRHKLEQIGDTGWNRSETQARLAKESSGGVPVPANSTIVHNLFTELQYITCSLSYST